MTYAGSKFNALRQFKVQCSKKTLRAFKTFNRRAPFKTFRAEASVQRSKVELFKVRASRRYLCRVFEAKKRFGLSVRNYEHVHVLRILETLFTR
jgi:hypothetical protein